MTVKINAKLPDESTQDNGLAEATDRVLAGRKGNFVAVVMLHCRTVEENVASGDRTPKMDIVAIELMDGPDEALAMDMLALQRQNRTGQQEMRSTELAARHRRKQYAAGEAVKGGRQDSMLNEDVSV